MSSDDIRELFHPFEKKIARDLGKGGMLPSLYLTNLVEDAKLVIKLSPQSSNAVQPAAGA
jgi:hypothetical protein